MLASERGEPARMTRRRSEHVSAPVLSADARLLLAQRRTQIRRSRYELPEQGGGATDQLDYVMVLGSASSVYERECCLAIAASWWRAFVDFATDPSCPPPGQIDNEMLLYQLANATADVRQQAFFLPEHSWRALQARFGGGPRIELRLRAQQTAPHAAPQAALMCVRVLCLHADDAGVHEALARFIVPGAMRRSEFVTEIWRHFFAASQEPVQLARLWLCGADARLAEDVSVAFAGDGDLASCLAAADDEDDAMLVLCSAASPLASPDRLSAHIEVLLASRASALAALGALRRTDQLSAIAAVAGLWFDGVQRNRLGADDASFVDLRLPVVVGLLLAAAATRWDASALVRAPRASACVVALHWLVRLLLEPDFCTFFNRAARPAMLVGLASHVCAPADATPLRELALLALELVARRCPALACLPSYVPAGWVPQVRVFMAATKRLPADAAAAADAVPPGVEAADAAAALSAGQLIVLHPGTVELLAMAGVSRIDAELAHVAARWPLPPATSAKRAADKDKDACDREDELQGSASNHVDGFSTSNGATSLSQLPSVFVLAASHLHVRQAALLANASVDAEAREGVEVLTLQRECVGLLGMLHDVLTHAPVDSREAQRALAELVNEATQRAVHVAVVGVMKAGKSSLVSGLVGREVVPSRASALTVVPTLITHDPDATEPLLALPALCRTALATVGARLASLDAASLRGLASDVGGASLACAGEPWRDVYRGDAAVLAALVRVHDTVRLGERCGLFREGPHPLAALAEGDVLAQLPCVRVCFASLAGAAGLGGALSLVDTPGPNELGLSSALGGLVQAVLAAATVVALVLDYSSINSLAQAGVRELVAAASADWQGLAGKDVFVLINKYDQRSGSAGHDVGEPELRRAVLASLAPSLGPALREDRVFAVSAKFAQAANAARAYLDAQACGDDALVLLPDPAVEPWVESFARIALGETWASPVSPFGYMRMLETNDVTAFRACIDTVWQASRLAGPLERVVGHCFRTAGLLAMRRVLVAAVCNVARAQHETVALQLVLLRSAAGSLERFSVVASVECDAIRGLVASVQADCTQLALAWHPDAPLLPHYAELWHGVRGTVHVDEQSHDYCDQLFSASRDDLRFAACEDARGFLATVIEPVFSMLLDRVCHQAQSELRAHAAKLVSALESLVAERLLPRLSLFAQSYSSVLGLAAGRSLPAFVMPQVHMLAHLDEREFATNGTAVARHGLRTPSYRIRTTALREAFVAQMRARLHAVAARAVQQYRDALLLAIELFVTKVNATLSDMTRRMRQALETRTSRTEASADEAFACEQTLWRMAEFWTRARDLIEIVLARSQVPNTHEAANAVVPLALETNIPLGSHLLPTAFASCDVIISQQDPRL